MPYGIERVKQLKLHLNSNSNQAFRAVTTPVSSTACEQTFSKMKRIKTTVRNTMTDDCLIDLCLLAVERNIDVNFEQLIDKFSDIHKNSRIMLK